jgi:hypothetical protein
MSVYDALRSGLKFFLMSLGISSPPKKPQATPNSAAKPKSPK